MNINGLPKQDSIASDLSIESGRVVNASSPPPPVAAPPPMEIPKSVAAFDETIIDGKLKKFIALTVELNVPVVAEQVSFPSHYIGTIEYI